jgi:hypothetical protein
VEEKKREKRVGIWVIKQAIVKGRPTLFSPVVFRMAKGIFVMFFLRLMIKLIFKNASSLQNKNFKW